MSQNMLSWLYKYFIVPEGETSGQKKLLHSEKWAAVFHVWGNSSKHADKVSTWSIS